MEEFGIGLEHLRRVPSGSTVMKIGCSRAARSPETLEHGGHVHQGGGADVRAVGVAEGDELELAGKSSLVTERPLASTRR